MVAGDLVIQNADIRHKMQLGISQTKIRNRNRKDQKLFSYSKTQKFSFLVLRTKFDFVESIKMYFVDFFPHQYFISIERKKIA